MPQLNTRWCQQCPALGFFLTLLIGIAVSNGMPSLAHAQTVDACSDNPTPTSPCGTNATDPAAAPPATLPSTRLGNPIDLVTGIKSQSETDFALSGSALTFRRHYTSAQADHNTGLGQGWRHSYSIQLVANAEAGREIIDANGRRLIFDPPVASSTADSGTTTPDNLLRVYPARLASDGHLIENADGHTWVVPDGRRLRFVGSYLVTINWPGHRSLTMQYNNRRLISITDETGRVLGLEYTPGRFTGLRSFKKAEFTEHTGHLAALVLPDGQRIHYDYDEQRNLTRVRFADGTHRRYHYEDPSWPSHLTGLTERTGNRFASWRYDEAGYAVASEHADGIESVSLAVNAPEVVGDIGTTTVTNSVGASSTYTWRRDPLTGAGLLLESTGAGCVTCPPTGRRYQYDTDNRLSVVEQLSDDGRILNSQQYSYDSRARLIRVDETLHQNNGRNATRLVERREYEGDGFRIARRFRPSIKPDSEAEIETLYTADGLPQAVIERGFSPDYSFGSGTPTSYNPIERQTTFEYDHAGRLVSIDGPRLDIEDITTLSWDSNNRLIAINSPANPAVTIDGFDANGYPLSLRLGNRSPFVFERNGEGRILELRQAGHRIRYGYDAEGRLSRITDTDGRTVKLAHDTAGRLTSVTDDLGRVSSLVHDSESRLIERSQYALDGTLVESLAWVFDAEGRMNRSIETHTDADGQARPTRELEHETDAGGLIRSLTDTSSGASLRMELDRLSNQMTVAMPDGTTTHIDFNAAGYNIALTDARDNTTASPTDDFGRQVLLDSPDTGRVRFLVDEAGNRISAEHENGSVTRYRYDAANRLVERVDVDGTTRWVWNTEDGTLLSAEVEHSTDHFDYDSEARLTSHRRDINGYGFETRYRYDTRDRLVEKTLPDGRVLVHHYHDSGPNRGQLRAITTQRWFGLTQQTVVGEIDLDARDGESSYISASGIRNEQRFAANGELTELVLADTLRLAYTYDDAGRISGIDTNGQTSRFGYSAGRLSVANTPRAETRYRYDSIGNRLEKQSVTQDGSVTNERYRYASEGNGNRLLERIDTLTGHSTDYHYNHADGAPSSVGELEYTYNAQRRPVAVHRDGHLVSRYQYNAFGERIKKIVYSRSGKLSISYYLYDGNTLTAEVDEAGKITAQYVYIDGHRPVAKLGNGTVHDIHTDHLGTPRLMTDADGQTVWRADYSPFGEAAISLEHESLPLRLPGQYHDAETGTHYNYFRDYDPATGRYVTSDPIGLAGGLNAYAYARNRPFALIDPLGLTPLLGAQDDGSFHLTAAQYGELLRLGQANRRTEYYFLLHDLTGSQLAMEMAQISSNSGLVGGVAWNANEAIKNAYRELYPVNEAGAPSIAVFSEMIFQADLAAITHNLCSVDQGAIYRVPNDLEMIGITLDVWDSVGLRHVAPPLIRELIEQRGDVLGPISLSNDLFLPEEYESAAAIIRDATELEFSETNGLYLPEFIRDHTEHEIEYTQNCVTMLVRAPTASRVEGLSEEQEELYDAVAASPLHDVIVVSTNSVHQQACRAARR